MKNLRSLLAALAFALVAPAGATALMTPEVAHAQDLDDLDVESGKKKTKKEQKEVVVASDEIVREIERGYYIKANAGVGGYLLKYGGGLLRLGSVVALTAGNDFVDKPNQSMAWELELYQGVHNGMPFDVQTDQGVAGNDHIQGDTRTFAFKAAYEYSAYPGRRVGLGVRVGGGVMLTPLLMNRALYETQVEAGEWGGARPSVHRQPHFPVFAGPTFEYYTKLSHFSVGIDADVMYVIGFDLGFNGTGYMKYTF